MIIFNYILDQFGQELDDAIYRFPLGPGDTGDDDMEMMIQQYVDEPGLHNHMDPHERMRAIQLPLWSDMVHGLGGLGVSDPVNAGGASSGANNHVSPNHPLLMGRQTNGTSMEPSGPGGRSASRSLTRQLHRGFRGYLHMGSRGGQNPTAPTTLLQNFLGGNTGHGQGQDWLSQGLRRGGPLLVDFGYAILDSLENDVTDLDNSVMGSTGRAALSTIPSALVRWNEESRVIDGDSIHDCVTALKPRILEIIEKMRDEESTQRKAKKREEDEAKRKASEEAKKAAAATAAAAAAVAASADSEETASETATSETATTMTITPAPSALLQASSAHEALDEEVIASSTPNDTLANQESVSSTAAQMAEDLAAAISSHLNRGSSSGGASAAALHTNEPPPNEAVTSAAEVLIRPPHAASVIQESAHHHPISEEQALPPPPPPPYLMPQGMYLDCRYDFTKFFANSSILLCFFSESSMRIIINPGAVSSDEENEGSLPAALAPLSPSPEQSESMADRDVTMRSENTSPRQEVVGGGQPQVPPGMGRDPTATMTQSRTTNNASSAVVVSPNGAVSAAVVVEAGGNDPGAGPSGTSTGVDYSSILGMDISDLPEGVDPSFLAALPEVSVAQLFVYIVLIFFFIYLSISIYIHHMYYFSKK